MNNTQKLLLALSNSALRRISPEAAAAALNKKVPLYLVNKGDRLFGVTHPYGGAIQPTLTEHLTKTLRQDLKKLNPDKLAQKPKNSILDWYEKIKYFG